MNHQTSHTDDDCYEVLKTMMAAVDDLDKLWGEARMGLALARSYFEKAPLTSDDLAHECGASRETVRRWLKPLINIQRVEVLKEGRNIRYSARAEWARRTCELLVARNNLG